MAERMLVRILGPVEAVVDGHPLDLGPRQRRAVLAALAVDAGATVSIDALAERVWGDNAPEAPRSAIYAHVARLRRALGVLAGLSRHGSGYRLDVDRDAVDLFRFRSLLETSRGSEGATDRITMLRQALDLWRGAPLAPLRSTWAAQTRAAIESQYVGATAMWAAEELRLANPAPVIDRLIVVIGGHPLAEPLIVLLMRALCAVGRTAEALQSYADARERLAEKLGAEPGPELRDLHVAILRGQFDRTPRDTVTVQESPAREPRQLPADLSRFTGRERELARINGWLTGARPGGAAPVMAIHGPAGTGKSALTIHAAHRLSRRFPDGQLYLDLGGSSVGRSPLDPDEALHRLLRTLGVSAAAGSLPADEAAVMFRSLAADRRFLLVLDNAVDARQVRPLLPGGSGCATLVSSRRTLVGLGDIEQIDLDPLTVPECVRLLERWVGDGRHAADPQAAATIVRRSEGLPVALSAAGARLAARPGWPLAALADRLTDPHRRLDNLEFDGAGVRASLTASWQQLALSADPTDRAAAEAFVRLAVAGGTDLGSAAAARLLRRPVAVTERLLERAVDVRLLDSALPGRYRMGALVQLYAQERHAGRATSGARVSPRNAPTTVDMVGAWDGRVGARSDI